MPPSQPRAAGKAHPLGFSIDVRKVGEWEKARDLVGPTSRARIARAQRIAVRRQAQFARRKIVEGLRTQAPAGVKFKPLVASTLAARKLKGFGGTKALIVRGDLRNSITVKSVGDDAFVGVLRTAVSRTGERLVNVAEIQEKGRTIVMRATPKVIAMIAMIKREESGGGSGGGKASAGVPGIIIIKIPARPFMQPVFDKWFADKEKVSFRILLDMARILKADYGFPGGKR